MGTTEELPDDDDDDDDHHHHPEHSGIENMQEILDTIKYKTQYIVHLLVACCKRMENAVNIGQML